MPDVARQISASSKKGGAVPTLESQMEHHVDTERMPEIDRMVMTPTLARRELAAAKFVMPDSVTTILQVHEGVGQPTTELDLVDWILRDGRKLETLSELFDQFCWRLVGSRVPIWRASLHGFRLHPQMRGLGLRWWHDEAIIEEFAVKHGAETDGEFAISPIRPTIIDGVTRRYAPGDPGWQELPLLRRLADLGVTDYLAIPVGRFNTRSIAVTFSTLTLGGYANEQIDILQSTAPALGAVVEAHFLRRVTDDLLQTYLGREAGRRVISGEIMRGQGAGVRAIVMATDLREFTRISDILPPGDIIELLDDYFECVCSAVHARGGEVLKFIGDGVLAIFPTQDDNQAEAALRAVAAAQDTLAQLHELNRMRAWAERPVLKAGIGLHLGDVIFGNVGAQDRLDFTVIGPDVNLAFRLESLTKQLKIPIVTSRAFAQTAPAQFTSLGQQQVRGLAASVEVFTPVAASPRA
jgi:adenylate cyclase